jgi:type VI protein secretion system component Hcp
MPIYLNAKGITGDVSAQGFSGQVALDSVSFGQSRSWNPNGYKSNTESSSAPNVSEITASKKVDIATVPAMQAFLNATVIATATITCTRETSGGSAQETEWSVTLTNFTITSQNISASPDGYSPESLTFAFTAYTFKYAPMAIGGKAGSPQSAGWNSSTSVSS